MTPSTSRKLLATTLPAALAVVLAACSPKPAEPAAEPAPPADAAAAVDAAPPPGTEALVPDADPGLAAECNADAVQALVGQEGIEAVLEQAKTDAGASILRVLKPGDAATMDFRPERLDIALDENGLIQSLRCG